MPSACPRSSSSRTKRITRRARTTPTSTSTTGCRRRTSCRRRWCWRPSSTTRPRGRSGCRAGPCPETFPPRLRPRRRVRRRRPRHAPRRWLGPSARRGPPAPERAPLLEEACDLLRGHGMAARVPVATLREVRAALLRPERIREVEDGDAEPLARRLQPAGDEAAVPEALVDPVAPARPLPVRAARLHLARHVGDDELGTVCGHFAL